MTKKSKQGKTISSKVSVGGIDIIKPNIEEKHRQIIDEYFSNGFNKSKAVLTVVPDIKLQSSAGSLFIAISKKPEVKKYIAQRQLELREACNIVPEMLVNEHMNHAFSDITVFMLKTKEEIAQLPSNIRRQIASYEETETTVTDRKGNEVTTNKIKVRLKDSRDALKDLSKFIGLYEAHNKQKAKPLDITKLDKNVLKALLVLKEQEPNKTIDI